MKLRNVNAILVVIVSAQFLCASLWFAGNGVLPDLADAFQLPETALGHLTTAIQGGFIIGTLVFAMFRIVDWFSPSHVVLLCAICGAIANLGMILPSNTMLSLLVFRFMTGFFLAGVYPVGMKLAADYFSTGLGKALGYLLGALVLGTALPHLLREYGSDVNWTNVLIWISALAIAGGVMTGLFVADGPHRAPAQSFDFGAMIKVFRPEKFRKAAFGYFGHMWELYTYWAFVPVMLEYYKELHPEHMYSTSLWSFLAISIGGLACIVIGFFSSRYGVARLAVVALVLSGICCLLSPLFFQQGSVLFFLAFILFWGMTVIPDSPMFSTLITQEAQANVRGTALTIVVCIGFAITIVSIQLINWLRNVIDISYVFLFLVPGPILGLLSMLKKTDQPRAEHV